MSTGFALVLALSGTLTVAGSYPTDEICHDVAVARASLSSPLMRFYCVPGIIMDGLPVMRCGHLEACGRAFTGPLPTPTIRRQKRNR